MPPSQSRLKVVIVGAGLSGSYLAYLLARAGLQVVCIDPGDTPGRASDANPGGINPLHGPGIPGNMSSFAMNSYRIHLREWNTVLKLSGIDFQPRRVSRLLLALTMDEAGDLAGTVAAYRRHPGFSARELDARDLRALCPPLNPQAVGGILTQGNATVDSALYTRALLRAAEKSGAQLLAGSVDGFTAAGTRVTALQVGQQRISCDCFVLCTGPHTTKLDTMLAIRTPIDAVKGELLLAELSAEDFPQDVTWRQFGLYHASAGRFWLGGTQQHSGLDAEPSAGAATTILGGIRQLIPSITRSNIIGQRVGLRPVSPDGLPILGTMANWSNGYIANGGGVKGVLYSAGMAQSLTGLIARGQAYPELDLLSPQRFQITKQG